MRTTFRIHYVTRPGESVEVVIEGRPVALTGDTSGWWQAVVHVRRFARYRYRIAVDGADPVEEAGPDRHTPRTGANQVTVVDRWRAPSPYRSARGSALFARSLAALHPQPPPAGVAVEGITFRLHEPDVAPGTAPAVAGAAASLGRWDAAAAVRMEPGPFPWWTVTVPVGPPGDWTEGAGYKYVIVDADGSLRQWEEGGNRTLPALGAFPVRVDDEGFHGLPRWRGAGVAIPVFSLRTDRSAGVGEFADLAPFVDWAADAGLSLVQILPVNDTVATYGWEDSYPYNVVSVLALHPQYVDLDDLGLGADDAAALAPAISALRATGDLPEVDYATVMEHKQAILRRAFALVPDPDPALDAFVAREWEWLGPYSTWCALRDHHGTPDHAAWGDDAAFSPDRVAAMAAPGSPHRQAVRFACWVQFHLYRQLDAVAAHARGRGVALKGDLPIGVSPTSVEVWTNSGQFHLGAQAGAPPDAYAALGQNWGFPTYDWERMAEDGYRWWRRRFAAMARHTDVYRIDHILGFFRIWEIPPDAADGRLGRFRPCLPLEPGEVAAALALPYIEPLRRPTVDTTVLAARFGDHAAAVAEAFFEGPEDDLRLRITTQRGIIAALEAGALGAVPDDAAEDVRSNLLDIAGDVLLLDVEGGLHPRIAWDSVETYRRFDPDLRRRFDALAEDFFYERHDDLWEHQGRTTIPAVVDATDMLACGEDLGMVQPMVPQVMNDLGLLSLEVERMPKTLGDAVADPARAPYLSVVSPSTHDSSPLREWWAEDAAVTARYWREVLGQDGDPPAEATPEIIAAIVARHLESPAMLCVVPLSDYLAMDASVRRSDGLSERINDPADRNHRWRYRMHLTVADLAASPFTARLRAMVERSGR